MREVPPVFVGVVVADVVAVVAVLVATVVIDMVADVVTLADADDVSVDVAVLETVLVA